MKVFGLGLWSFGVQRFTGFALVVEHGTVFTEEKCSVP